MTRNQSSYFRSRLTRCAVISPCVIKINWEKAGSDILWRREPITGIVAGNWFDMDKGRVIYNCEDDRYPMIGKEPKEGKGRAPTNLLSSTIGDELVISNNGQSRMFSVSIKDRGAILPGGHTGKAFWYSKSNGSFVSSTYYYKEYPGWVKKWNAKKLADKYKDTSWELLHDVSTYVFGKDDDRPFEVDMFGLGTTFPHPVKGDSKYFYASLIATPFGDELTAQFFRNGLYWSPLRAIES